MLIFAVLLAVQAQSDRLLHYYDPAGRMPSTYADYCATQTDAPFSERVAFRGPATGTDSRLVLVLVNDSLYARLPAQFATWFSDMSADGFTVKAVATSGGRAANLRQVLQAHRDSGLVAGVLVGELPAAWWEDGSYGEDYPIDLFFSDLDGTFADADADGMYDSHSGNAAPDIAVGRVCASRLTYAGETRLVADYLERNHRYRTGQLSFPDRGMVYNEVSWYPNDHGMGNLYGTVAVFNDENTTAAAHYKGQLKLGYEFVHCIIHSSPWVHSFFLANDEFGAGSLLNFEVPPLAPQAGFYFVNGCMCGRYTEKDCLSNWFLFAQPGGLAAVASTQLMYGVSNIAGFYTALDRDSTFGAAFLTWHRTNYQSFRGTVVLGDPTLKIVRIAPKSARTGPVQYRAAAPTDWTEYAVDTSNFVNGNPAIGYSQGRLRLIFDSGRIVRSDNYHTSFDGTRFARPESVAWHEYYDVFPSCCTDAAGRLWVAWQSFRDYNSGYDHFQLFSSYLYNGSWSSVQRVGALAGFHDVQSALASGSDTVVWCAFKSWRNGQGDIWASSATKGGAWATPVRLTSDSLDQVDPCLAVDHENHPWVFWTSFAGGRWQLHGRTYESDWQPAFCIDSTGDNGAPRAIVDGAGRVWVTWHKWQSGESDIWYAYFDGSTWTQPEPLTATPADDVLPDIAAAPDGSVWACWQSRANGPWDIYTAQYNDGWSAPAPVTADTASDYDPVIRADSAGSIWVAWASDRRGYWNIYAARSLPTAVAGPQFAGTREFGAGPNPFSRQVRFAGPARFEVRIHTADGRLLNTVRGENGRALWSPAGQARGVFLARLIAPGAESEPVVKLVRTE